MSVKLDILNAMLEAIGSSSISSTVGRHPGLLKAEPILARVNRRIQARGHWFNTDYTLKILPSTNGEFVLPQGTLKADTSDKRLPYVRRGTRLYDPKENTYLLGVTSVEVDCVIELDYDDLPVTAIDLIQASAVWDIVQGSQADAITLRSRKEDLTRAIRDFEHERLQQSDISLRDNPNYSRIIGGLRRRYAGSTNPVYVGG